jgi:murein DD-endopeptidase MepM/ murein hydrolase activator NlpD
MAEFPVPLDNLIAYVKTLHPEGGPLENVSDAFAVSEQLDEQSDALLGYFVDQARRSGLSWSQIGAAMGVTKQAAQKRFVPGQESILLREIGASGTGHKPFSRFTDRAIRVLFAAGHLATDRTAADTTAADSTAAGQAEGAARSPIGAAELVAAFLSEPEGLAAKAIGKAGLSPEQVYAAVGFGPAPQLPNQDRALVHELAFDDSAKATFKEALRWALRMGHNYIGTEHLLLGVLFTGGPVAEGLTGLGLTPQRAEELITAELTDYVARLQGQISSVGRNRRAPDPGELRLRGRLVCSALRG